MQDARADEDFDDVDDLAFLDDSPMPFAADDGDLGDDDGIQSFVQSMHQSMQEQGDGGNLSNMEVSNE